MNKESVSESESNDDSDLDPDFTLHIGIYITKKYKLHYFTRLKLI